MSTVAKQKGGDQPGLLASLFQFGLYKPNQGRVVRQVTAVSVGVVVLLAAYELGWAGWVVALGRDTMGFEGLPYTVFFAVSLIGLWIAYRIVNVPKFADFMIAVEAEMKKVSWPSRKELTNASIVVVVVILILAGVLFIYDLVWQFVFKTLLGM